MKTLKRIMENQTLVLRTCLLLMLAGGLILSVMIPTWQTPDEYTHLQMISESYHNSGMADILYQDMSLDSNRIMFQPEEKMNLSDWKAAMTRTPYYTRSDCMPRGVSLSVIKHLPAALGLFVGILLHLPTFWVMELAEVFALLFYIGICGLALKLMPVKKEVLLMVMAFPMTLQQASSINYDSVLLPLCFLFIAYIFHMRHEKERLGWKDVLCTLFLLAWIIYIKIPYVFLGFLVLLLPKEKIHLKLPWFEINGEWLKKWRIPLILLTAAAAAVGIYVLRNNVLIQLVGGMVLEWKRTIRLFLATVYTWGKYLLTSSVGQFGWLDSSVPFWFVTVSYVMLIVCGVWGEKKEQPAYGFRVKTRCFLWILSGILVCFVFMSMADHTIRTFLFGSPFTADQYQVREALYQIPYIGGLQGRYFLPFLALPFLALPERGYQGKGKTWAVALYILVGIVITVGILYGRYW